MKPIAILAVSLLAVGWGQDKKAGGRLPTRGTCRSAVSRTTWGKQLKQIPSTVIDKGVLRHVPYLSYRAGDYELNVYGDPAAPCSVEIGVYGESAKSEEARKNCFDLIQSLFKATEDKKLIDSLNWEVDKQVREGLTFEVTPPAAEDAYGGWWISVYDEPLLDKSRATPKELESITTTRDAVKKETEEKKTEPKEGPDVDSATEGRWAADDLKEARKPKDVPEEKQAVYKPVFSRKNGVYVPDRSEDDTGMILFVCANSDKHEDREETIKACGSCGKDTTFFWNLEQGAFVCFKCGAAVENASIQCSICGTGARRARIKHR